MTQPINDQSFLGRVFDSYQNMTQIAMCLREASRQRGIAQPRLLELSRRPTGIQDFFPDARWQRYPTHHNDVPTLDEPITLPFADKSVDGILISDVYEHIPASSRPGLLKEMLRVADGLVLVACPNGNEVVSRLDRMVFDFIWGKYGERFTPLEQHVMLGVEPLSKVVATLKEQGADQITVMPANYVYRWIHMILIYFDLQHRNPSAPLFEPLNRIYNERLSPYDYREPCYRYLIAVATNPEIQLDQLTAALTRPPNDVSPVAETDEMLVRAFREIDSNAADELRKLHATLQKTRDEFDDGRHRQEHAHRNEVAALGNEVADVHSARADLEQQLVEVRDQLRRMSASPGWRLLSLYGKLKYPYLVGVYRLLGLSRYLTDHASNHD